MLWLGEHNAVDKNSGNLDIACIKCAFRGYAFNLRNDDTPGIARRNRQCEILQRE